MLPSSQVADPMDDSEKEKTEVSEDFIQVKNDEESTTKSPIALSSAPSFPEGGLQGWLTIFGAFLIQYTCFGYINSFGVYEDYYTRHYLTHYTPSDIGSYLLAGTLILNSLGLFMLSLTHENSYYQIFLSHGVMMGLATGITYVASLGIAGHYFHKRRPIAVGIISAGSALGAVLNPIMLNKFFNGPIGFHRGVRISAGINTALLLIALAIMRTRLPPQHAKKFPVGQWMREPAYVSALIGCLFVFFGLFYPVFSLQLMAVKHGVDSKFAFYAVSILNVASCFGRTLPQLLAPKVGVFNLSAVMTIFTGVIIFSMVAIKDITGTILFAIFFGFFSGAAIAVTPAMIAHLCTGGPAEFGTRLGIYFGVGSIIGLFATPLSGALLTTDYLWVRPIIFNGVMMTVSGLFYGVTRIFYGRGKDKWLL
ncbi:major facilitator superfamily domain-containing protein [Crepidotus variabilis]|uniref:Major facilitator superfamily domain-containing protein n=1 Tax=Crepidotus variabilis TaxID=179855 RepID=A0A9P6E822_9AGAR|nr:major facilitator superfamily domain-containing protein [Crepidotus variabilis]